MARPEVDAQGTYKWPIHGVGLAGTLLGCDSPSRLGVRVAGGRRELQKKMRRPLGEGAGIDTSPEPN